MDIAPDFQNARDSCLCIWLGVQIFREASVCSHKALKVSGMLFIYSGNPTIGVLYAKVIKPETLRF